MREFFRCVLKGAPILLGGSLLFLLVCSSFYFFPFQALIATTIIVLTIATAAIGAGL